MAAPALLRPRHHRERRGQHLASPRPGPVRARVDASVSFRIGDARLDQATTSPNRSACSATANWSATMPTSMGWAAAKPSAGAPSASGPNPGSAVMDKANPVVVGSSTYGLPINSRLGHSNKPSTGPPASAPTASTCTPWKTPCGPRATCQRLPRLCLNLRRRERRSGSTTSPQPGDIVEVRDTGGAAATVAKTATGASPGRSGWPAVPPMHRRHPPSLMPGRHTGKQGADGQPHADRGKPRARCCGSPPWSSPGAAIVAIAVATGALRLGRSADSAPSTEQVAQQRCKPR